MERGGGSGLRSIRFTRDLLDPAWTQLWWPYQENGIPVAPNLVPADKIINDLFKGKIDFLVQESNYGPRSESYPLVEYLLMLDLACREIQVRRGSQVESSDLSFRMYFVRDGESLIVASDDCSDVSRMPVALYHEEVSLAFDDLLSEIFSTHQKLIDNKLFKRILKNRCRGFH